MTGVCGQRIMGQGRAHAFSSVRSIYTILLAHVGKALSFIVCATRKSRQPPSHCSGDAFSFLCGSGGKKLPLPCPALTGWDSGPSERFCLFWAGSCLNNSWLLTVWSQMWQGLVAGGSALSLETANMACFPRSSQDGLCSEHSGGWYLL